MKALLKYVCRAPAPRSRAGGTFPRGATSPVPEPWEDHSPGRLDHDGGAGGSAVPQAASVQAVLRQPQPGELCRATSQKGVTSQSVRVGIPPSSPR